MRDAPAAAATATAGVVVAVAAVAASLTAASFWLGGDVLLLLYCALQPGDFDGNGGGGDNNLPTMNILGTLEVHIQPWSYDRCIRPR